MLKHQPAEIKVNIKLASGTRYTQWIKEVLERVRKETKGK